MKYILLHYLYLGTVYLIYYYYQDIDLLFK